MSNTCNFNLFAYGRNKDNLKRLYDIMNFTDKEYFLYRVKEVFICEDDDGECDDNGLYALHLDGSVSWDCELLVNLPDSQKREDYGKRLVTLPELCDILDIGVEFEAYENEGFFFREHYIIDHEGCVSLRHYEVMREGEKDYADFKFMKPIDVYETKWI